MNEQFDNAPDQPWPIPNKASQMQLKWAAADDMYQALRLARMFLNELSGELYISDGEGGFISSEQAYDAVDKALKKAQGK